MHKGIKHDDETEKEKNGDKEKELNTKDTELENTISSGHQNEPEVQVNENTEIENHDVEIQETIENKNVEQNIDTKENIDFNATEPVILEN